MSKSITQKMKYKQSVIKFSYKYGVQKAAIKFDEATKRIQKKVKNYYIMHKKNINKYSNEDYILEYININDFIKEYLK